MRPLVFETGITASAMDPRLWILLFFSVMVISVATVKDYNKTRKVTEAIKLWVSRNSGPIRLGLGLLFIAVVGADS